MKKHPIDFVVPWVDPNDPVWKKSFIHHSKQAGLYSDSTDKRYRDWGIFKYWFRSVEKFAPWVNKVHFITAGHVPSWLDINHPKLNFVKHSDYIPSKDLPTFNVNPIEINLHRIKALSEHFVYFNDDIFFNSPASESLFFKNGLPCDSAVMSAFSGTGFSRMVLNSNIVINNHFVKSKSIQEKPHYWFNPLYGPQLIRNFLLMPWKEFTGFYDYHIANSYLKSTFVKVWEKESELLNETSTRKFRHSLDLNQAVFRYWQLASNNFSPSSKHKIGNCYEVGKVPLEKIISDIEQGHKPLICLNDHDPDNLDEVIKKLQSTLDKKFPNKSSFEL